MNQRNKKRPEQIKCNPRKRSILTKTAFFSGSIVIFTVGIFVVSAIPFQKAQLIDAMEAKAQLSYTSIAQITASALIVNGYSTVVDHCVNVVTENPDILYVVITRHDGMSLVHTRKQWSMEQLGDFWQPDMTTNKNRKKGIFIQSPLVGKEVFNCSFRFGYSGIDWGFIHIGISTEKFYNDLSSLYMITFLSALLSITAGFFMSYFFSRRLIRPIVLLNEVTQRVGKGDFSSRVNILTGDEVESLAESFNLMTESLMLSNIRLETANAKLVESARCAGMAEVATGILHNVGNVLNSVKVTTASVKESIVSLKILSITRLADQLNLHKNDLNFFLTQNERGRKLPDLLSGLSTHLRDEKEKILMELDRLSGFIAHIADIVRFQQINNKHSGLIEMVSITEVIENALLIHKNEIKKLGITLQREFEPIRGIMTDRHKLMQIILNLLSNAVQAFALKNKQDKKITISVSTNDQNRLLILVADNGSGIDQKNKTKIFSYGFTTKKEGHGYGLHNSSLFAKEMGGQLTAESKGPEKGACFILELPLRMDLSG